MSSNNESIIKSVLRTFFTTFFRIMGFLLAFFVFLLFFSAMDSFDEGNIQKHTKLRILPDANGIREQHSSTTPVILQIDITGIIGTEKLSKTTVDRLLIESREDSLKDRVKGILLNVNSPGGLAIDSERIFHSLKQYKEKHDIPLYVFVDGVALSGGIYAAVAGDQIHATKASLVGSVGTIFPTFMNFSKLLEEWGIETKTVKAGKGKDLLNPLRPWKEGEEENIAVIAQNSYKHFVNDVVNNRPGMDQNTLIYDLGARVLTAEQGLQYNLIDAISEDREHTLKQLVIAAELEGEEYQVISLEPKSWIPSLLENSCKLFQGKVIHEHHLPNDLPPELMNQFLYLYRP